MIRKLTSISFKHTAMALLVAGGLTAGSWAAPSVMAAGEAVYISNTSYFTLSQAALSSSSLQFSVSLHNGDSGSIDFNQYGVRITDASGRSYTAKLSEKKSGSVLPGQDQTFRFYSSLPAGETADQLQVDVFRWDASQADFMNHIGNLPVASAVQTGQANAPEEIINLRTLDSTLSSDASMSFQLGQSVRVSENGKWYMYTQLSAKDLGASSVKLPSNLLLRLVDGNGLQYSSTISAGAGDTFLPNQSDALTLRTPISKSMAASGLSLEFYYLNQSEEVSLGTMNMNASLQTTALGKEQAYIGKQDGDQLTIKADSSVYTKQADGVHAQTVVTLSNNGNTTAPVPSFYASYQLSDSDSSVMATDNSTRNDFLAPKETVSYYFNAILPTGTDPNSTQLVVWEKDKDKDTASAGSSNSSNASNSSNSSNDSNSSNSSTNGTNGTNGAANGNSSSSGGSTVSGSSGNGTLSGQPIAVFLLNGASEAQNGFTTAAAYTLGNKLAFNSSSNMNKNLDISLVELHAHENDDLGYKTAIAKYKITNNGTSTLALPDLQNELIDGSGNSYTGSRQSSIATQITPGSSYIVSYSYLLPNKSADEDEQFALNVYDDKSVSAGKVSLGSYRVTMQKEEANSDTLELYPFSIKVNNDYISWVYNNGSYSYQLNLDLSVKHEDQVVVDSNFSKIEFDMVDSLGRIVGTQTATLTGTGKLVDGTQKIVVTGLKDEQVDSGVKVNMYEIIDTPNGTAKRLLTQFH